MSNYDMTSKSYLGTDIHATYKHTYVQTCIHTLQKSSLHFDLCEKNKYFSFAKLLFSFHQLSTRLIKKQQMSTDCWLKIIFFTNSYHPIPFMLTVYHDNTMIRPLYGNTDALYRWQHFFLSRYRIEMILPLDFYYERNIAYARFPYRANWL